MRLGSDVRRDVRSRSYRMDAASLPRLVRALVYAATLSEGEALCVIDNTRRGLDYGSEAANHYGGNRACLRAAFRLRALARDYPMAPAPRLPRDFTRADVESAMRYTAQLHN